MHRRSEGRAFGGSVVRAPPRRVVRLFNRRISRKLVPEAIGRAGTQAKAFECTRVRMYGIECEGVRLFDGSPKPIVSLQAACCELPAARC